MPSHVRMTIGLGAGLTLGLAAAWSQQPALLTLARGLRPLGTLFLNLLWMVVIPLVVTALFAGVAGLGSVRRVGRVRVRRRGVFLGVAAAALPEEKRRTLTDLADVTTAALIRIVWWVLLLAPLGIFALVAGAVAQFGLSLVKTMAVFVLAVIAGLGVFIAGVLLPAIALVARMRVARFLEVAWPSLAMAFSTTSSLATLPTMLAAAEEELKISRTVTSFVLPLGASINRSGSALFQAVAIVFAAHLYGVPLGAAELVQAGAAGC